MQDSTRSKEKPKFLHRHMSLTTRETTEFFLFIAPVLLGFLVFTLGPVVASLFLGFTQYDIVKPPTWLGLKNYIDLFNDPLFGQSLKVTVVYAIMNVPLTLVFALLIALLMNQKVRGIGFFRTVFYLPSVLSGVAVSLLWLWIFHPNFGLVNFLLYKIGINGPGWLFDETWALPSIVIMSLWGVGGGMLVYLGGLQGIPTELYEAAEIDGAGKLKRLFHITLPMISPVIFFNLVMGIIAAFQEFTSAYVMTNGGPNNATLFYNLYLYRNAFVYLKMGVASSMAWVLLVIVLLMTFLVFKSSPMWVFYQSSRGD